MGTLNDFYTAAAAAPFAQRRYALGAAYRLHEEVEVFGFPLATAQARILSLAPYANALSAAGLTATFNAVTFSTPPIGSDTFTGTAATALEAHTSDSGHTWVEHPSYTAGASILTDAGRLRASAAPSAYYLDVTPPNESYDVVGDFVVKTLLTGTVAVAAHMATAANSFYYVRYNITGNVWELRAAGATFTVQTFAQTPAVDQVVNVRLAARSGGQTVWIDGVQRMTSVEDPLPAAGRAGVFLGSGSADTTGIHLDNFSVTPA